MFVPETKSAWSHGVVRKFLSQQPEIGEPGLTSRTCAIPDGTLEYLLWRGESGDLQGVLVYYPVGHRGVVKLPGEIELVVAPEHRGRGIGSRLLDEAVRRWDIQARQQRYTPSSVALYQKWKRRQ